MAESVQAFDKLWISTNGTDYTALEFLEGSGLGLNETFVNPEGVRGTRQETAERTRRGPRQALGTLLFAPTASELDLLLPWILGADEATDVFALAETVPARYLKTSRDGTRHVYDGCKVNRATFQFAEGAPMTLAVETLGVDEGAGGTEPADAISDDAGPYVLSDAVLTLAATAYAFRGGSVEVNNYLETKWNNSLTPTAVHATRLAVGVNLVLPYGDASALYGSSIAGIAGTIAFTNGARSCTFTLAGLQTPKQPLGFGGKGARDLVWQGFARRTGSTAPISVTNDSTG